MVAKSVGQPASLVSRREPGKDWQVVGRDANLDAGDLVVGMPGAVLDSANGAVRLAMHTDLEGRSPYPVVESAVILHPPGGVDLDLTLDRGRIDLTNRKERGAARVRVHVRQAVWELSLAEPGAEVALELYGRWPAGVGFSRKPGPDHVPMAEMVLLVLKGEVALKHDAYEHLLSAPPGPALMEWDSVDGQDEAPTRLDRLPEWARAESGDTPAAQQARARRDRFRKAILANGLHATLMQALHSDDEDNRRAAVNALAALDDLQGLGEAMRDSQHPDVWENGVLALRRWIGRGPGQDQKLYRGLVDIGKLPPVEAETTLELLHSFGQDDLARPETYQMLIDYLEHNRLAIRGLAYWHLSRLVPAGKKLGYHPTDAPEARAAAVRRWRELVPPGRMPPRPGTADNGSRGNERGR